MSWCEKATGLTGQIGSPSSANRGFAATSGDIRRMRLKCLNHPLEVGITLEAEGLIACETFKLSSQFSESTLFFGFGQRTQFCR
jgi:hypothetical protein